MKPVHVGLLVLGAALAGGLAVKMTQPPPLPVASAAPATPPPTAPPEPQQPVAPPVPPRVALPPKKPSPLAPSAIYSVPVRHPETVRQTARPPVVMPRRREEIAQERPLDVPPLPPEPPPAPAKPPPAPLPPLHQVTLRPGMTILVRIDETLSAQRNIPGSIFTATLAEPLVVDGLVIAERGARATGRVLDSPKNGQLQLALLSVMTADGQRVAVTTDSWTTRSGLSGPTVVAFRVSYPVTITEHRAI